MTTQLGTLCPQLKTMARDFHRRAEILHQLRVDRQNLRACKEFLYSGKQQDTADFAEIRQWKIELADRIRRCQAWVDSLKG